MKKEWYSADGTQVSGNGKDLVTFDLYRTTNTLDSQGVPAGETRKFTASEHKVEQTTVVQITLEDSIDNLDLNDVLVITFQRTSGTAKLTVQRQQNYGQQKYETWGKYSNQGSEEPTTFRIRVDELVESFTKDQNNGKDMYKPILIFRAWGNNIHYNVTVRVEKAIGAQRSEVVDHVSSVQPYSTGITVSQTDNWQKTISNLEKVDPSGNPYHYYVLERRVDGYADVYQLESDGENITIKNTENSGPVEQDTVSRTVVKVWDHGTSPLSARPASITVNLVKNGTDVVDTVTLNSGNSWTDTIDDLPMYDEHGAQIEYTWVESVVPEGYTLSNQVTEGSVTTITNKYTKGPEIVEVNGVKTWKDSANAAGYRPRSININLLEKTDSNAAGTKIRFKTVTADDGWTWRFPNLPKYRDGEQLIYTVEEEPVMNYETTYDGYNITNTYTPEKISVTVTKVWEDGENADNDRPSAVTVRLYKDGVESQHYDLSGTDNWTHTFPNLDKYSIDERGQIRPATYTIHEDPLTDYETVYIKTADGYEIKNTRYITLNVTKTWDDRRDQSNRPSQLVVRLYADDEDTGKFVTLNAGNEWSGSLTVPVFKGSTKIQYEWVEPEVSGYLSDGLRKAAAAGGTNFINSLPIKISGTKVWKDANNQDGKRPETVKILLMANGSDTGKSVTINKNGPFTWEFDNLPKYENGVLIDYTVDEERTAVITDTDSDDTYKAEISGNSTAGFTVTNTHTPQKTDITINKVWDDADDQDGKRGGVAASMQLYKTVDGPKTAVGDPVTVGTANDWSHTWPNLPVYEGGKAITYSVAETLDTPNGYSISGDAEKNITNGGSGSITNSYTPQTTMVAVIKNWNDNDDQDGKRSGVTAEMQLHKTVDGTTTTVGVPVTVGTANNWSQVWTELPVYEDGKEIRYSVSEVMTNANGYTSDGTSHIAVGNGGSITITNSYTPNVTTITVSKTWHDANDQDGKRSGVNATVQLYKTVGSSVTAVGSAVAVGKGNEWSKTWSDLPVNEGGKAVVYSVAEWLLTANGYTSDCTTAKSVSNGSSLTITNSYTPEKTSVTINKIWDDKNNQDGKRGGVVASMQLYKTVDGVKTALGDPVTVGTANNWSNTWGNLPVYESGRAIIYSVAENLETPNGYSISGGAEKTIANGSSESITNTYTPETTSITIKKVWSDANDQDGKRSGVAASMQLYKTVDGTTSTVGEAVTVGTTDNWKKKWENLPVYESGKRITYSVGETLSNANGYTSSTETPVTVSNGGERTITNSYTPEKTTVTVHKAWNDANNQDGKRSGVVATVQLYKTVGNATNSVGSPVQVGTADNWSKIWEELPVYENGTAIVYSVQETLTTANGYTSDTTTRETVENGGSRTINNSYTPQTTTITVVKSWNDNNDQDGKRSGVIASIQLHKTVNGTTSTVGEQVAVGTGDNWNKEWTGLPVYENGHPISYSVSEILSNANGYTSDGTSHIAVENGGSKTITNSYTPNATTITVIKNWDDANDQDGKRAGVAATVQLYKTVGTSVAAVGSPVEVGKENEWSKTWSDLPVNEGGRPISYSVTESLLSANGYTSDCTTAKSVANGSSQTITNSYTPAKTSITINKVWSDANNQDGKRSGVSAAMQLYKTVDGEKTAVGDPVSVGTANNWSYTWQNLPVHEGGKAITYSAAETFSNANGYTITGGAEKTIANGGSGSITNSYTPETTTITIKKVWSDASDQDGKRSGVAASMQLYKTVGENTLPVGDPVTVGTADHWTQKWENLPVYENGTAITYSVEETLTNANGYTSSAASPVTVSNGGEQTITNSYTPAKTSVTINKIWDDENNQDGKRGGVVARMQLYKTVDGVKTAVGDPVTAGTANSWSNTWTNLPVYEGGKAITYSVAETLTTAHGYTIRGGAEKTIANGGSGSITNSYTPETTTITIKKVWSDANNQDGKRSGVVASMQLYKTVNGTTSPVGESVAVGTEDHWSKEWTGLPVYENGTAITYSVGETLTNANGYTSSAISPETVTNGGEQTITNSYTPETTSVTINKIWDDANDQDGKRGGVVARMQLYKTVDGVKTAVGDPVTAGTANSWSNTWTNLPVYEGGKAITYSAAETLTTANGYTITGGAEKTIANGGSGSITNSYSPQTTAITVNKSWNDNNDQDGKRSGVTASMQLHKTVDGTTSPVGEPVAVGTANNWSQVWTELPVYENGKEIRYSVSEVMTNANGYTSDGTSCISVENGGSKTITNSYTPNVTTITVIKNWDDANDQDGKRAGVAATVRLYKTVGSRVTTVGSPVEVGKENEWSKTWSDLPVNEGGRPISYSVTESLSTANGYTSDCSTAKSVANGSTLTIINSYTPEKINISGTKVWDDLNDKDSIRPASITIRLYANSVDTGKTAVVSKSGPYTWGFTNVDKYANGSEINYTVDEDRTDVITGTDTAATYAVSITGNKENGFTVTNKHTPRETVIVNNSVTVTKVDENGTKLPGAVFDLYNGSTSIKSFRDSTSFTISTADNYLASLLPADGTSITLDLKETTEPDGYNKTVTDHLVTISASKEEGLKEGVYVTTITYTIKVNGESQINIANSKKTENDRVDDFVTVKKADQFGADLTGAVFTLYNGETVIGTYNAPEFTISTANLPAACLPDNGAQTTLTLKETTIPDGYEAPEQNYALVISASDNEALTNHIFVTTRTYTMTINGAETLTVTNTKQTDTARIDSSITINKQDEKQDPLEGASFTLYSGTTPITTYSEESFTISTSDPELASYLPEAGGSITLNLKETSAPAGYSASNEDYVVEIAADTNEALTDHVFVTTTTYTITVNGANTATVTNTKKTGTARVDDSVLITKKDQDGELLAGETFTLYSGETVVGTYNGSSFTISTNDTALADHLPTPENPVTLTLKETTIPDGYEAPDQSYTIRITASDNEVLTGDEFITTRTYVMTIDNAETLTVTNTKKTDTARVDNSITINKVDGNGNPLFGETFTLYSGETAITTYTGESFTISTSDPVLASYLPAVNGQVTLNLKETAAPAGYNASSEDFPIVIAATAKEELKNHVFVTTTTYTITVNGANTATVTNTKKTGTARVDDSVTIIKKDQDGKLLTGETFTLYNGETVVGTYNGSSFTISTNDAALASYLPADGNSTTLTLVETTAPDGYEAPNKSYELVISASDDEQLTNGTFITTRTYVMTIDGAETLTVTNTKKTAAERVDDSITVIKQDENETPLSAETFTLYSGETGITTYSGERFTISTADEALAPYLPAAGSSVILNLKETAAPAGYSASSEDYRIVIAAAAKEELKNHVFVTTTTYTITVNGADTATVTNTKKTGTARVDDSVNITKKGQDGKLLAGETFTLYSGETVVGTYSGSAFTISTNDTALASYLPTDGNSTTLTLVETTVPDGYEASGRSYELVISASDEEKLTNDIFITTRTYVMTIDGSEALTVINTKKTGTARKDDSVTIKKVDEDGNPLSAETFTLYSGIAAIATYTGESFTISTSDEALAPYLPAAGSSVTLNLKETAAPEGYRAASDDYHIVIAATAGEALTNGVFITTTTYTISVNGEKTVTIPNTKETGTRRVNAAVFVTKVDQDNKMLSGEIFTLYAGGTAVRTYSGSTFTISTNDIALTGYLPTPGNPTRLILKETQAPEGYEASNTEYNIDITADVREVLENGVFVTVTTYTMTINGAASLTVPNTKKTGTARVDDYVTINKVDENGDPLSAETFSLYSGETLIRSYSGESFTINTNDAALARYLPAVGTSVTLILREPVVPEGYNPSAAEYPIVIAASADEALTNGVFVTTTTYIMSVNGQKQVTVTNTKKTGTARVDDEIFITKVDQDNNALSGEIFTLYDGQTVIKTFTGAAFTISTNDTALRSVLPTPGKKATLTLRETTAPAGYEPSMAEYIIEITASADEALTNGVYVTTTTYHMTINGAKSVTVSNIRKTGTARIDDYVTINKVDEKGQPLGAETFSLYSGETFIRSYSGESFTINTADAALARYLPAVGTSVTLILKEPVVPMGYNPSTAEYPIVIAAAANEALTNDVFVTTTTYTISVNGQKQATVTNTKKTGTARVDDEIFVSKVDQDNNALSGEIFTLYDGQTAIKTFSGSAFTISTNDAALSSYLPTPGNSKQLTLKETKAPDGYTPSAAEYTVEITAAENEQLTNGVFVTTTTYSMTINGGESVTVSNTRKTGTDRVDDFVTIFKVDENGNPLSAETFSLYSGDTFIRSYSGESFTISTDDTALAPYLPAVSSSVTLTLREPVVPDGYNPSTTEYPIVIATAANEALTDDVFVTTTTYSISVNGQKQTTVTNTKRTGTDRVDDEVFVTKVDQDNNELNNVVFTLFDSENTAVKTFTGGTFAISTNDTALASYLPAVGNSATLKLKETGVPDGYEPSAAEFTIQITAADDEKLTDGVFVTTTTYHMTINGKESVTIPNTKKTAAIRNDDFITIYKVDENNEPLSAETFSLFSGETLVRSYSGASFTISTDDSALVSYLPAAGTSAILMLKEPVVPEGYNASTTEYPIVISAEAEEELTEGVFVTTTNYTIFVNSAKEAIVTNIKKTGTDRVDDEVLVTKVDQDNALLSGAVLTLFNGQDPVTTFSSPTFAIGTDDLTLAPYLPEPGNTTTLRLKETKAPDGYEPSNAEYMIEISASADEALTDGVFVTTTTYHMTIDGGEFVTVRNNKKTSFVRVDNHVTVNKADQYGEAVNDAVFTLYNGENPVKTYTGSSFTISTNDPALAALLPAPDQNVTLVLRETSAPDWYELSEEEYVIDITSSQEEKLTGGVFVTTTTYDISINGNDSLNVIDPYRGTGRLMLKSSKHIVDADGNMDEKHQIPFELWYRSIFFLPENDPARVPFISRDVTIQDDGTTPFTYPIEYTLTDQTVAAKTEETFFRVSLPELEKKGLAQRGRNADGALEWTIEYYLTEKTVVDSQLKPPDQSFDICLTLTDDKQGHILPTELRITEVINGNTTIITDPAVLTDTENGISAGEFVNRERLDTTISISGSKVLSGRELRDSDTWKFTITSADNGPLPAHTSVLNEMDRFVFEPITFTASDLGECHMTVDGTSYTCESKTYHYTVTESGTVNGVTNDSAKEFAVTVSVDENGNVKAVCDPENPAGALTFTNVYVPAPVSLQFGGSKSLLNYPKDREAPEFSFTLQESGGRYKDVKTIRGEGAYLFNAITFDRVGEHTYVISETVGNDAEILYDSNVYTVHVKVYDDGSGQLRAEVSGDDYTKLNFTNKYQMVLYRLDILPETGFSAAHPEVLNRMPKDLHYTPSGLTLQIPSLDVMTEIKTVPLYNEEYPVEWLDDAAGLLEGSSVPGEGYSIITGHNHLNTMEAGPFAMLSYLEVGDRLFIVDEENALQIFRVYAVEKIAEDDISGFEQIAREGKDSLLLITCEDERPDGGYANRRIVAAEPYSNRLQF